MVLLDRLGQYYTHIGWVVRMLDQVLRLIYPGIEDSRGTFWGKSGVKCVTPTIAKRGMSPYLTGQSPVHSR